MMRSFTVLTYILLGRCCIYGFLMLAMNYLNLNNKTHNLPLVCLYPRLSQVKTAINVETFEHSKIRFTVSVEKLQLEEIQADYLMLFLQDTI
jgi:hypothetical protein